MLKKENRLGAISKKQQTKISTPLFNLIFSENSLNTNRFLFSISKKVDKRATVRNKTKRKVRSVIEEIFDKIVEGYDFVFYLKIDSIGESRENILSEITRLFKNNKLLK